MSLSSPVTNIPARNIPTNNVVTRIIAGAHASVTPASGTGEVVISVNGGEGGAISCPILTPMWIDYVANDRGWVLSDDAGTPHTKEDYPKVYEHLFAEYTEENAIDTSESFTLVDGTTITISCKLTADGHKICDPSQTDNLNTLFNDADIGCAWFFILDTENETFVLPRTKYGFHGERDYVHANEAETGKMLLHFSTGVGANADVVTVNGNGGIIDGELFKKTDGTDQITRDVPITISLEEVYTVQNDCLLYVECHNTGLPYRVQFFIGDNPIAFDEDSAVSTHDSNIFSFRIPVKKGTKISANTSSDKVTTADFYEYRLSSLAPQLAFPNWSDTDRTDNLFEHLIETNVPYTVDKNGFLFLNLCLIDGAINVKVNGVSVAAFYDVVSKTTADYESHIIPVSNGDIVTVIKDPVTNVTGEIYLYGVKTTASEADVRYDLKVIEDGILCDRTANKVVINGDTAVSLPKIIANKVRDFIVTLTVVSNGNLIIMNNDGTDFTTYMFDENEDDPLDQVFEVGCIYQLYFTESVDAGTFRVSCTKLIGPSLTP